VGSRVYADATKLADTAVRRGTDAALPLTGDITGAKFVRIVVTDAGDGDSYDRRGT
jgi:alpha-galactosidase